MQEEIRQPEADSRFPSGPWVGFFTDKRLKGKIEMELRLHFENGRMTGEGRDMVSNFVISGRYYVEDGKAHFDKTYVGQHKHTVNYTGFNEGKGIWGTWELHDSGFHFTGGFHIWPEGFGDPTLQRLRESLPIPEEIELMPQKEEPVPIIV